MRGSYDVTNLKVSFNVDGTTAYGGSLRAAIVGDKGDKFAMGPTSHDDYAQKAYGLAVQTKLYSAIIRAEGLRLDDRTPLGARLEGWGVQVVVAYGSINFILSRRCAAQAFIRAKPCCTPGFPGRL